MSCVNTHLMCIDIESVTAGVPAYPKRSRCENVSHNISLESVVILFFLGGHRIGHGAHGHTGADLFSVCVEGKNIPTHPPTYTSSHPHILPPTHPPTHTSSHPHILPPTHPPTHTSSHPHILPPTHPPTHTPTHSSTHTPTHSHTHTSSHPHILPPTHPPTHTSSHPYILTPTHPHIHSCISLSPLLSFRYTIVLFSYLFVHFCCCLTPPPLLSLSPPCSSPA